MERQAAQAKQTEARLVRALNEDKVSPPPAPRSRSAGPEPPREALSADMPWRDAARRLLERGKLKTALSLAEDVLKADSDNQDALQIAASALETLGEPRLALACARRLLALQAQRPRRSGSIGNSAHGAAFIARPGRRRTRYTPLSRGPAGVGQRGGCGGAADVRTPARGQPCRAWLADGTIWRPAQRLTSVLMPPPDALGPDDALPLPMLLGRPVTARQLSGRC